MSDARKPDEVRDLVDEAIDGVLPEEKLEALTDSLHDNPEHLAELIDGTYLHAQLHEMASCQRSLDDCLAVVEKAAQDAGVGNQESASEVHHSSLSTPHLPRRFRASRHKLSISVAVSVAVIMSSLLAMHLMEVGPFLAKGDGEPQVELQPPGIEKEEVATLTGWHNITWRGKNNPHRWQPRIRVGDVLSIESGFAEVTYDTGVRVVFEGPAEYELLGQKSGRLIAGRLTARITSTEGEGFSVDTSNVKVEDLGTEFGIFVDASKGRPTAVDVQLFEGKLKLYDHRPSADSTTRTISEPSIVRVVAGQTGFETVASRTTEFVRNLETAKGMPDDEPELSTRWAKIDDFEQRSLEPLAGQGDWNGDDSAARVIVDPSDDENQLLAVGGERGTHMVSIPIPKIADNSVATVFFRVREVSEKNSWASMLFFDEKHAGSSGWEESAFYLMTKEGHLCADYGSTYEHPIWKLATHDGGRWHNVWVAIRNGNGTARDRYMVYIDDPRKPRLAAVPFLEPMGRRDGGSTHVAINRLAFKIQPGATVHWDDLYIDTQGVNLTIPADDDTTENEDRDLKDR